MEPATYSEGFTREKKARFMTTATDCNDEENDEDSQEESFEQ